MWSRPVPIQLGYLDCLAVASLESVPDHIQQESSAKILQSVTIWLYLGVSWLASEATTAPGAACS